MPAQAPRPPPATERQGAFTVRMRQNQEFGAPFR